MKRIEKKRKEGEDYTTELVEGVKVSSRVEPTVTDEPMVPDREHIPDIAVAFREVRDTCCRDCNMPIWSCICEEEVSTDGMSSDKENVCPNCFYSWDGSEE